MPCLQESRVGLECGPRSLTAARTWFGPTVRRVPAGPARVSLIDRSDHGMNTTKVTSRDDRKIRRKRRPGSETGRAFSSGLELSRVRSPSREPAKPIGLASSPVYHSG